MNIQHFQVLASFIPSTVVSFVMLLLVLHVQHCLQRKSHLTPLITS
jgi:hypothetical protein